MEQGGLNVYRLGFFRRQMAASDTRAVIMSYVDSVFCFALQICLTIYVGLEMIDIFTSDETQPWNGNNAILALIVLFYSLIVFNADYQDTITANQTIYTGASFFSIADQIVNIGIHIFLFFAGFIVIFNQETYIDGVLNAAALLFIVELDNTLPDLLGYSAEGIVENYLTKRCLREYKTLIKNINDISKNIRQEDLDQALNQDFCDYYLTNMPEEGSDYTKGIIYQPFTIKKSTEEGEDLISPSSMVTERCLITKLKWWYTDTHWDENLGTNPRIGKLEITLMDKDKYGREKVVIINPGREKMSDKVKLRKKSHELEGVFVITSYQMAVDILRLRVCGSKTASGFKKAFEYYSLWEVSPSAARMLDRYQNDHKKDGVVQTKRAIPVSQEAVEISKIHESLEISPFYVIKY